MTWLDGLLFSAPIPPDFRSVLDVGCGSGAWALDVASHFPFTTVLGIDLTPPIKPADAPDNCRFEKADVEQGWLFVHHDEKFDFIHARMLANGIRDWPKFFSRCFDHIHPGGWIEVPDVRVAGVSARDGSTAEVSPAIQWFELFRTTAAKKGLDPYANQKHSQRLSSAGFVNIKETPVEWLVGGQSALTEKERQIGDVHLGVINTLIDGVTETVFQHEADMDICEVRNLAARAKKDLLDNQGSRQFFLTL